MTNRIGPLSAARLGTRLTEVVNDDFQRVAAAAAAQHMLADVLPAFAIESALARARQADLPK